LNGFGKEVCRVEVRGYKGYLDLKGLDHVAHVKVASGNVLHSVVVLGVVGNVAGALAVCAEASRAGERCIDAGDEFAMVIKTDSTRPTWPPSSAPSSRTHIGA